MNKPVLGLALGGVLGAFDGLTALFYPEVRPLISGIVIGSTFKGLLAGVLIGAFARKVRSMPMGLAFGLGIGLLFGYAVAAMPDPSLSRHYYLEIMLPGGIVGLIAGYATQRYGSQPARAMKNSA